MVMRIGRPLALLAVLVLVLPSCAFLKEHQKAVMGAGLGAVAGAGLGYAIKGKKGALVGGLLGALAGGAIGEYLHRRDKTAQQTYQEHRYRPTQGVRIELVGAGANPSTVSPGAQVVLEATYALMAPNAGQELQVSETRLVTLNGAKVAETTANVARMPGTYTSKVPITLPPNATPGTYRYIVSIQAAGQATQLESAFVVQ